MDKTKKLKGNTEKECADRLRKFMVEYDENPTSVARGIRELLKVKFTAHDIGRWFNDEKGLMLHKWDHILLYIEWVTKNK
ncbi:MAG TPA: hypothetical protein EYN67_16270 [Flavobacteriales bacterium]|jgi:hypothetical protein|nr:hypothetical protein [Flavobacteriales bacterium]